MCCSKVGGCLYCWKVSNVVCIPGDATTKLQYTKLVGGVGKRNTNSGRTFFFHTEPDVRTTSESLRRGQQLQRHTGFHWAVAKFELESKSEVTFRSLANSGSTERPQNRDKMGSRGLIRRWIPVHSLTTSDVDFSM